MDSIDDIISPNRGKLIIKDGVAYGEILDAEMDVIEFVFNNDGCVEIKTKNYSFISLSYENLQDLQDLIEEADVFYSEKLK